MTTTEPTGSDPEEPTDDGRPGPMAWCTISVGCGVIGWALAGVIREADRTHPGSWATWVIGAALVHDLVVLPIVLLVGLALSTFLHRGWRGPARAALVIVAIVAAATWPTVARYGARADNPSVLPLDAARHLAVIAVGAFGAATVAALVGRRRSHRTSGHGR